MEFKNCTTPLGFVCMVLQVEGGHIIFQVLFSNDASMYSYFRKIYVTVTFGLCREPTI